MCPEEDLTLSGESIDYWLFLLKFNKVFLILLPFKCCNISFLKFISNLWKYINTECVFAKTKWKSTGSYYINNFICSMSSVGIDNVKCNHYFTEWNMWLTKNYFDNKKRICVLSHVLWQNKYSIARKKSEFNNFICFEQLLIQYYWHKVLSIYMTIPRIHNIYVLNIFC